MNMAPTVSLRIEIRDLEAQVRRMGRAHREKKMAEEFTMAEVSALHHLAEAKRFLDKVADDRP